MGELGDGGRVQRVDVTYTTGAGADGFFHERVLGLAVEQLHGVRFLVLTLEGEARAYVALDRILVLRTRPADA